MIVVVVVVVVLVAIVAAAVMFLLTPIVPEPSTRPVVVLTVPEAVSDGIEFVVAGASRAEAASRYRVGLLANATMGPVTPLVPSVTFLIDPYTYTIAWTDLGGEGTLTGGDAFRVTCTGGLPADTEFTFRLLWSDGSQIAGVSFTTDPPSPPVKPTVTFSTPEAITLGFRFEVASISRSYGAGFYRVNLLANASASVPVTLAASTSHTVSPYTYTITWTDLGGEGSLTSGDQLWVTTPGGLPADTEFTFNLFWGVDGSLIASATFFTSAPPAKPAVIFTTPNAIVNGFEFVVAGVSQTRAASNYRVNLQVNASASVPVTLAASTSHTVSPYTYTITWTDLGGEGDLTGGDVFRVTRAGGLPANTSFTFRLLWSDGSQISSVDWTT